MSDIHAWSKTRKFIKNNLDSNNLDKQFMFNLKNMSPKLVQLDTSLRWI